MKETEAVAAWLAALTYEDLPSEVRHQAALSIADFLGCALLGSTRAVARDVLLLTAMWGGEPTASVIGSRLRTSPAQAAFANGVLGGASPSLEDTATESFGHPGINVIPAALAVAEHLHLNRRDLLVAVVAGYEVAMRVGAAVGWRTFGKGWHPRGGFNVFGAAAAAGKLLRLSEDQFCAGLGLAGVQAGGLVEPCKPYDGWYLLSGASAQAGVIAGFLASRGWSGGRTVLEGPLGYLNVVGAAPTPDRLTSDLGTSFEIMRVTRKHHASSSTTHSAIDAILELRATHQIDAARVIGIHIATMGLESLLTSTYPTSHLEASLRYLAAVALHDGHLRDAEAAVSRRTDPNVRRLFELTNVVGLPSLSARLPDAMPATVTITMVDGRTLSRHRDHPRGDPREPLTDSELREKLYLSGASAVPAAHLAGIWDWATTDPDRPVLELMQLTKPVDKTSSDNTKAALG